MNDDFTLEWFKSIVPCHPKKEEKDMRSELNRALPEFFHLLGCASDASYDVDAYDLDSTKPESVMEFKRLQKEEVRSAAELVAFIRKYGDSIEHQLGKVVG